MILHSLSLEFTYGNKSEENGSYSVKCHSIKGIAVEIDSSLLNYPFPEENFALRLGFSIDRC